MLTPTATEILHQWTFPEFEHHQHSFVWKMMMSVLLAGGIALSLWYRNITFAFLLLIVGIILVLRESRAPELMRIRIHEEAMELLFDDHHHQQLPSTTVIPWEDIQSFWIIYRPPLAKNLYVHFQKSFRPPLRIPLQGENPVSIRETLLRFIEEDLTKKSEPFSDILARRLKI